MLSGLFSPKREDFRSNESRFSLKCRYSRSSKYNTRTLGFSLKRENFRSDKGIFAQARIFLLKLKKNCFGFCFDSFDSFVM